MADKPTSTRTAGNQTRPNPAAQFETHGYIIDEEGDWALRDVANDLLGIATLIEDRQEADVPEMTKQQWSGMLRTFSRTVKFVTDEAAFTNRATARKRGDN